MTEPPWPEKQAHSRPVLTSQSRTFLSAPRRPASCRRVRRRSGRRNPEDRGTAVFVAPCRPRTGVSLRRVCFPRTRRAFLRRAKTRGRKQLNVSEFNGAGLFPRVASHRRTCVSNRVTSAAALPFWRECREAGTVPQQRNTPQFLAADRVPET